jgi:heat shock protein HslJ
MTPVNLPASRVRRTRRTLLGVALASTLALGACGDDTTEPAATEPAATEPAATEPTTEPTMPDTTDPSAPTLDGRSFLSTSATGFDLVAGSVVRLTFSDGVIGVQAGCNSMGGDYTLESLDGGTLVVGPMSTTEMACESALMDQDDRLAELLSASPAVTLDGDTLTITSGSTSITLLDREVADPDRPLEGTTWTLDGIVTGDAISSVPAGVTATVTIVDGRAQVRAGCNTGSAAVTIGDDTIEFGPMALTKMACAPEAMEVETAVTSVLSGATSFEIEAGRLTITAATPSSATTGLSFTAES